MKLALHMGYWGAVPIDVLPLVREAEALGFDSVWSAEAYGSDAVTTLTWAAAHTERIGLGTGIMQIPARTPAAAAMTAITLDHLSGGRFRLGLGMSGPQVVEGWHGQPYGKPLARTREYVGIVRAILRREAPVEFHGEYYDVPALDGTGLGKPLKTIVHPLRSDLPIYLAAIGPRNVALAAEVADGWIPVFCSPQRMDVFRPSLEEGFARAGKPAGGGGFDIAPMVFVLLGDDVQACRDTAKPYFALYIGGMGARGRNFYFDLAARFGYEAEATEIQDHYLEGRKGEAAAAVPDRLVDEMALTGPAEKIRDGLEAWKESGVTTLMATTLQIDALRALAEAAG
ncbi:MAG: LLM class F420-dependent oxidoreductase [Actinobacteria bacterium]|nr:LLM class F420-dependent oxidoreductase [Actinomycetota bacterium]